MSTSTSSPSTTAEETTTAEELIAESSTINDAKDIFLKSIEGLSSEHRVTQKSMAKALRLPLFTFVDTANRYGINLSTKRKHKNRKRTAEALENKRKNDRERQRKRQLNKKAQALTADPDKNKKLSSTSSSSASSASNSNIATTVHQALITKKTVTHIADPNENDVLCGRGRGHNNHAGNVQFRDNIHSKKKEYLAPSTKKHEKAPIAAGIVNDIRTMDPPGRFLKEDKGTGLWLDIGDAEAIKKTSQALREVTDVGMNPEINRLARDSFMNLMERLPSKDRLSKTTIMQALRLSRSTFYRKVKEYDITLNDFVVDMKRKRAEEKEQKKQDEAAERKESDNQTKLSKDGKTLFTGNHPWLDCMNNLRNKLKDFVKKSAGKADGLSRVVATDGTDLTEFGLFKLEAYPEAIADIYSAELESVEVSEFSNTDKNTSTVQLVGEVSIDPTKLPPWLAHRIKVAETGTLFGKTIARTDNVKGQKYNGKGRKHRDDKFKHIIRKPLLGVPKSSILVARVLEKTQSGKVKFFRESDGKGFLIDIKKGEL